MKFPNQPGQNRNDYSVVCRLVDGNVNFLFTGDAGGPSEAALTGYLSYQILKVGHHGSRTSTSSSFLSKVEPEVGVISVGAGNTYGHPTAEALQRLQDEGATIYRTDLNGNIVVTTDGNSYTTEVDRTASSTSSSQVQTQQTQTEVKPIAEPSTGAYVGSVNSNKYHYPSCRYAQQIKLENQIWFNSAAEAQAAGYVPCGSCCGN